MAEIKIKIGAALDRNMSTVFKPIVDAANAANRKIASDEKSAAAMHATLLKSKLAQEKEILKAQMTEEAKVNDHIRQLSLARLKGSMRDKESAAKAERSMLVREAEATVREVERVQARSGGGGGRGGRGGGRNMPYRMGYWSMRNFSPVTPMLSIGGRIANDIARGTGVDFNLGSMIGKQNSLQTAYQQLSNQGYQEHGKGAAAIRQDPRVMQTEGMAIAKQYGLDPEQVAAASTKFVDLTGNLEGARAAMGGLARLSNATGADLTDMASAAASVQVQLDRAMGGDAQGKAKALTSIMRSFAGQGKLGAVEIKDFAAQMAKVAVITNKFGGDREKIFGIVGALAQESRKAGGSASASQAATSVTRFASMLTQGKTAGAFAAKGINVFANKEQTILRNPEEIIMDALSKTKGNIPAMSGLFKNVMANRAVEGFSNIYNTTKGTNQEKLQAVKAEFDELIKATMTEREEEENNARVMETNAKKAQVFQDKLQEVVGKLADSVMPALEKLAPKALEVAEGLTKLIEWAATNPMQALPVMLGAAIAKAGLEQALRAGIENMFKGAGASGGGGGGAPMGALGTMGAALTIAATALTIYEVGTLTIDKVLDDKSKKEKTSIETELDASNVISEAKLANRRGQETTPELKAKEQKVLDKLTKQIAEESKGPGILTGTLRSLARDTGNGDIVRADEARDASRLNDLKIQMEELRRVMSGTLRVQSVNPPMVSGGSSRTGPDGEPNASF